jgi:cytochrome P450
MRAPQYSTKPDELFETSCIENPHPFYQRLRTEHPISCIADTGVHLVVTWDLIAQVLEREEDFSANLTGVLIRGADGQPQVFKLPDSAGIRVIATADEPDHATHRAIVQPRLTARRIAQMEGQIETWASDAVEKWLADGGGDFIPIAEAIPARVVAELLGLPQSDIALHRTWAMMGGDILAGVVDTDRMITLARETRQMSEYIGTHLNDARSAPLEDVDAPLLHALAIAVDAGDITFEEALGIAAVMFGAGGESTAALIGSVVRQLAEHPEIANTLRREPASIPAFVEEITRLEPPFKFHYRVVRRSCELGGISLEPGDRLILLWASANRDVSFVEDGDSLRLDRSHSKIHMSFGRGLHFCVGAALARLEARIVCEQLLARTDTLALVDGDPPVHTRSIFVRRLERLALSATESASMTSESQSE